MTDLFLEVLNLSFSATWVVLAVVLARLVLKKAPRGLICALWALVALRLLFGGIEAPFSLLPSSEIIPPESLFDQAPMIHSGVSSIDNAVNPVYSEALRPMPGASVNPLQVWLAVFANLWGLGMAAMTLWAALSCLRVRRQVLESLEADGVYLCDRITSPFIFGLFRPKIYLPSDLPEAAVPHVLAHERAHIARRDHWWKPLGFALLTINWFNPALWLAYILLCRDIEMACDERVVRTFTAEEKKSYSAALLRCSVNTRRITACPLAFGEVGVKQRIKSVLHYKKPAFWIILAAVVLTIVLAVGLLTDPLSPDAEIRWDGVLYVQEGRACSELPPDAETVGTLRSVLHDQTAHPNENSQSVNLSWEYAGQPLALSNGTLYIEEPGGEGWLPFVPMHSLNDVLELLDRPAQIDLTLKGGDVSIRENVRDYNSKEDRLGLREILLTGNLNMKPSLDWDLSMLAVNYAEDISMVILPREDEDQCLLVRREADWLMVYRDESWAVSAWSFDCPALDAAIAPWQQELAYATELFSGFATADDPIYLEYETVTMQQITLHHAIPACSLGSSTTDTHWEWQAHVSYDEKAIEIQCRPFGKVDWMTIRYIDTRERLSFYASQEEPITLASGAAGTLYHSGDPARWCEIVLDTTRGRLRIQPPNVALQITDWKTEDYQMALAILGTLTLTEDGIPMYGQQAQPQAFLNRVLGKEVDYLVCAEAGDTYEWESLQGREKDALRQLLENLTNAEFTRISESQAPDPHFTIDFMLPDGLTNSFSLRLSGDDLWTLHFSDAVLGDNYWLFRSDALSAWAQPYLQRAAQDTGLSTDQSILYRSAEYENLTMTLGVPDGWTSQELPDTVFGGRFGLRCRPVGTSKWMDITFYDTEDTLYSAPLLHDPITLSNGATGRLYHASDPTHWELVILDTERGQLLISAPSIIYSTVDWTPEDYQTALDILGTLSLTQEEDSLLSIPFPTETERPLGITLHVENVTRSGATLVCTQDGTPWDSITTGSPWNLERYEDGEWVSVMPESTAWTTIAYGVNLGMTTTWNLNWNLIVGSQGPGRYRVSKTFRGERRPPFTLGLENETTEQTCYAEFTIE